MKVKIKSSSDPMERACRAAARKEDRRITRSINKNIRKQNKAICKDAKETDFEEIYFFSKEIELAAFNGYYFA